MEHARIIGETVAADQVVVEILAPGPHAADVQRDPGLEGLAGAGAIIVDADRHVRGDREGIERATADPRAGLELRPEQTHVLGREERRDPAVGEFAGQAQAARGQRRQVDRHRRAHGMRQQLEALVELEDLAFKE